jgi:hypothetical protein
MKIFVKDWVGRTHDLYVNSTDIIAVVKGKIQDLYGHPPD